MESGSYILERDSHASSNLIHKLAHAIETGQALNLTSYSQSL